LLPFIQASADIISELLGTSLKSAAGATTAKHYGNSWRDEISVFGGSKELRFRIEKPEPAHNNPDFKRPLGVTVYRVDRHNRRSLNKLPSC
jgi:hypothetical protein